MKSAQMRTNRGVDSEIVGASESATITLFGRDAKAGRGSGRAF